MTRGVGFDKFWDEGGGKTIHNDQYSKANPESAVTPDVAAKSLVDWISTFDISKTGQYWAPRGPA